MKKYITIKILLLIILTLVGCGRKGPPKPPEEISPEPVKFLELVPSENSVKIRFQEPKKTVGGDDIIALRSYHIGRRSVGKDSNENYLDIAEIEVNNDGQSDLTIKPNTSKSSWVEYEDKDVVVGTQWEYVVVAEDDAGYTSKTPYRLRVTFLGTNSVIENLPLEDD